MPRDRRWDFLYDREKQPVKAFVVERLGDDVARDLSSWPPPVQEFSSEELRGRWSAALAERPRDEVIRLALELSRLDLAREWEELERRLGEARERLRPGEEEAARLLVRYVTEKCLRLQEWASGARLRREDLADALRVAERRLFAVTRT